VAVVRPPLGLPGLVSVELATERLVASLPEDHRLAGRSSLGVADVLPEPIVAAPVSPGPWRDYWLLTDYRSGPPRWCADGASRPRARAVSTASARLCAPSLAYRLRMCVLMVVVETDSWPAISGADRWVGR
jgi:DNA-binding transcriptional LysR family regulator